MGTPETAVGKPGRAAGPPERVAGAPIGVPGIPGRAGGMGWRGAGPGGVARGTVGDVGTGGANAGYPGGWPPWLFGGVRRMLGGGDVGCAGDVGE